MRSELKNIYSTVLKECVDCADMSLITDSPFTYFNQLDDITIKITGEVYGDDITFKRGKILSIDISSDIVNISDKDKKEFSEKLSDDFWKIINKI